MWFCRSKFNYVVFWEHKAELEPTGTVAQPGSVKGFVYEAVNNGCKCDAIDFLPCSVS